MGENTEAKRSLLHILTLYCVHYNKTIGYCQGTCILVHLTTLYQHEFLGLLTSTNYTFLSTGMAYVAALLLMNDIPEEV